MYIKLIKYFTRIDTHIRSRIPVYGYMNLDDAPGRILHYISIG